jgi:hypothetical protein
MAVANGRFWLDMLAIASERQVLVGRRRWLNVSYPLFALQTGHSPIGHLQLQFQLGLAFAECRVLVMNLPLNAWRGNGEFVPRSGVSFRQHPINFSHFHPLP